VADESIFSLEIIPSGWFAKETQADGWFDRDLLDLTSTPAVIRIYGDDGGEPIKRKFYERQLAAFEAELAAIEDTQPKARKRAVKRAVEALQPIVATVDTAAAKEAAAAILTALRSDLQRQAQRTAAKATIERELARIAKARRKQRDEAALMLLM
jgi:hypothetical protein